MNHRTLALAIASVGVAVHASNGCAQGGGTPGGVRDESSVEEEDEADVGLGADSSGDSGDSGDTGEFADQGSQGSSGDTTGSTSGAQGSTSGPSSGAGPSSSGSTSGGGTCDGSGNCDTCFDCAVQGPCAGAVDACLSDAACAAVDQCVFNCNQGDQQCFDQCMQGNGADLWLQADDCIFCGECTADCQPDFC